MRFHERACFGWQTINSRCIGRLAREVLARVTSLDGQGGVVELTTVDEATGADGAEVWSVYDPVVAERVVSSASTPAARSRRP